MKLFSLRRALCINGFDRKPAMTQFGPTFMFGTILLHLESCLTITSVTNLMKYRPQRRVFEVVCEKILENIDSPNGILIGREFIRVLILSADEEFMLIWFQLFLSAKANPSFHIFAKQRDSRDYIN